MPRFFRRVAEGVFDLEDLKFRTHELARFVRAAASHYGFGLDALYAVGFSNGANIAASLLLLEPELLRGAVLLRPMMPLQPERTPALTGTSVLIAGGRLDPIIPATQTEELASYLRAAGADVELRGENAGHGLMQAEVAAAREWWRERGKASGCQTSADSPLLRAVR
jgi:predicted esterase